MTTVVRKMLGAIPSSRYVREYTHAPAVTTRRNVKRAASPFKIGAETGSSHSATCLV